MTETDHRRYTISSKTPLPFDEAVEKARALLQEAGYGVLSEINVQAALEEKLGIEREPYLILGACNPPLANEGLSIEPELGALLPCNVVIYESEGRTHVAAVEPERMLSVVGKRSWSRSLRSSQGSQLCRRRARKELTLYVLSRGPQRGFGMRVLRRRRRW